MMTTSDKKSFNGSFWTKLSMAVAGGIITIAIVGQWRTTLENREMIIALRESVSGAREQIVGMRMQIASVIKRMEEGILPGAARGLDDVNRRLDRQSMQIDKLDARLNRLRPEQLNELPRRTPPQL